MPLFVLILLIISLGVCFVPVFFSRRKRYRLAQDYFVSSGHTPPGIMKNASIASALRMTILGPFFAFGASGEFWPVIVYAISSGVGVSLICFLRRPLLGFFHDALRRDRSITIHAFIAQRCGDDSRVRLLAAGLTILGLFILMVGEAVVVAALLKPVLGNADAAMLAVLLLLMLMAVYAIPSGHSGVMGSAQAQLGTIYLGLFGSAALLLYLVVSALKPMPPYAGLALVLIAAVCAIMLSYRRSKYVDTGGGSVGRSDGDTGREPLLAPVFRRLLKLLNPLLSTIAVFLIVLAFMGISATGMPGLFQDGAAALRGDTHMPAIGFLALFLAPLLYPAVDLANWQRLAAVARDLDQAPGETDRGRSTFSRIIRTYAVETALVPLFVWALGALTVAATAIPSSADVIESPIRQLAAQQNWVAAAALAFFLTGVVAIAFSTMICVFAASLCTVRYDMLPAFWPELTAGEKQEKTEATAIRRTIAVGIGLCLIVAAAFLAADAFLPVSLASSAFLALLLAFLCCQLAFVPLLLGRASGQAKAGGMSPAWALMILASGAAAGLAAPALYLATGQEPWLWAAVPACLGSGMLIYAAARLWQDRRAATA